MLKGFDQTTNIILQDCHERVFSPTAGMEQVPLGLYLIRGDNMYVCEEDGVDGSKESWLNATHSLTWSLHP